MATSVADRIVERVAAVVGPDGVVSGDDALQWSVAGTPPAAVAAPRSVDEVAELLRLASRERWRVEPAGAGGCLDWGAPPEGVDLVISTRMLAEVPDHEPGDLTISAGAGVGIAALADRLAAARQWLPWDPPAAPGATIGAIVAHGAAGPLRHRYGTPRDHVLGLQAVTGDGRVVEFGGRVVKNVAGYDLCKLLTGSRGTLAVLTRIDLRLRALPHQDVTLVFDAPDWPELVDVAVERRDSPAVAAVELMSPGAGGLPSADGGWVLAVRLHGSDELVRAEMDRLAPLATTRVAATVLKPHEAARLWRGLGALESSAGAVIRLANAPAALGRTVALALELGRGAARGHATVVAHVGAGIARVIFADADDGAPPPIGAEAVRQARTRMNADGGSLIVARGPAALLRSVPPFEPVGATLSLMRGIAARFDPNGVLSPGRFL